jgi:hypothetical protein
LSVYPNLSEAFSQLGITFESNVVMCRVSQKEAGAHVSIFESDKFDQNRIDVKEMSGMLVLEAFIGGIRTETVYVSKDCTRTAKTVEESRESCGSSTNVIYDGGNAYRLLKPEFDALVEMASELETSM